MSKKPNHKLTDQEMVEAVMPWAKRDQLNDADQELADALLTQEPELRDEHLAEKTLASVLGEIGEDEIAASQQTNDPAWAKFKTRLAAEEDKAAQPQLRPAQSRKPGEGRASAWRRFRLPQTSLGWLATAQTAALAAMAAFLIPTLSTQPSDEYVTLSSDGEAQLPVGNAVLVPQPQTTADALNTLLQSSGARIVDGPMANGGYLIALDGEKLDQGIESLSASEHVLMIQSLDAGEAP